jgi:hypothetical protein
MKLRWGMVLGLLVLAGCDASICTDRDALGNCVDFDVPSFDATVRVDAGTDAAITIVSMDSAVADASLDATAVVPAPDTGVPVTPTTLTLQQFCEARYATALQWRDNYFSKCCVSNADLVTTNAVLFSNFGFAADQDTVGTCVSSIQALPAANLTFVGTAAGACATKLAAQYDLPPTACPAGGIDVQAIEANIGHQAASPVQLAECRAALVGQVAFGAACTNPLECRAPYRCLGDTGAKTCRDALSASAACASNAECADGLVCVTSAGSTSGKVCRPVAEPLDVTVACQTSVECRKGTRCGDDSKCGAPVPELICK